MGLVATSPAVFAQSSSGSDQVAMLATVLSLYDEGDFNGAYEQVLKLEELSPEDVGVQRWKKRIEERMAAPRESTIPASSVQVGAPAGVPSSTGMRVAGGGVESALELSRQGDFASALEILGSLQESAPADSALSREVAAAQAEVLLQMTAASQGQRIADAESQIDRALVLARNGQFADARNLLGRVRTSLPRNLATTPLMGRLDRAEAQVVLMEARNLSDSGSATEARAVLRNFENSPAAGAVNTSALRKVQRAASDPYAQNPLEVSADFAEQTATINELMIRGRAQFVNGDFDRAKRTFNQIESIDPTNKAAKAFLIEIASRYIEDGWLDRVKTREEMLNQVQRSWQQPRVFRGSVDVSTGTGELNPLREKLRQIMVPRVTFNGTTLKRAVQSLSEISTDIDDTGIGDTPGVNMVVTSGGENEVVSFSVRQVSLLRVLDIVAQQTGYQWDVVDGIVEFSPGGSDGTSRLERAFIPISRPTLELITDFQSASAGGGRGADPFDPFAPADTGGGGDQQDALIDFFEASGIPFRSVPGASVINRGSRLLVNHTARAIDEIRLTLRELDLTDQVEIEAKFMEVVQGDLDELGFRWNVGYTPRTVGATTINQYDQFPSGSGFQSLAPTSPTNFGNFQSAAYANYLSLFGLFSGAGGVVNDPAPNASIPPPPGFAVPPSGPAVNPVTGNPFVFGGTPQTLQQKNFVPTFDAFGRPNQAFNSGRPDNSPQIQTSGSTLSQQFGGRSSSSSNLVIAGPTGGQIVPIESPDANFPGGLDLGDGVSSLFSTVSTIGQYQVQFLVNALQRQQGTDLLSAPKVTVISGRPANIVVAQELRYPESYSEPQLTQGGEDSGSSVAVAAGVPEDFVVRNVGVELSVTPTVEPNDKINLVLNPRVTEFEGFVEYGAPSVAIAGEISVTSPSGYFQPIFSVRSVETQVTVFDGATVVLGGLTREEVNSFKEKVPFLGDVPLFGRLFRSEGESLQKRNLLIFVTANLVSPGGSPSKRQIADVSPNSLFQSPSYNSPGGVVTRSDDATSPASVRSGGN